MLEDAVETVGVLAALGTDYSELRRRCDGWDWYHRLLADAVCRVYWGERLDETKAGCIPFRFEDVGRLDRENFSILLAIMAARRDAVSWRDSELHDLAVFCDTRHKLGYTRPADDGDGVRLNIKPARARGHR